MFRKLSLALAVSAALSPMGAFALGLGELETKSALNERFDATIKLLAVDVESLDGIRASIASPVDFARAGLDRPYLLSKLIFEPVLLKDGSTAIRVTTRDPVREPFLNFLLEVNWPKGRMIREFTVLLDPPVTRDRPAPVIARPAVFAEAEVAAGVVEPSVAPPLYTRIEGEYGPVAPGSTLWRVATSLDVAGATVEQVAIALFYANPDAFLDNDINKLKAGVVLQVPAREEMLGLSSAEAHAEFAAAASGRAAPRPERDQRLRIATPGRTSAAPAAPAPPREDIERVKTDLMMVKETSESTRQETDDLRSRIRELESQLSDIRELLKLKSDQLAQIQAGQRELPTAAAEPPLPEAATTPPAAEPLVPPVTPPEPAKPAVAATEQPKPPVAKPVQPPKKPAPPKAPRPAPAPEPGLLDQLLGNTTVLAIGGAVLVVLLSLVWLLMRRRREAEEEFQESALIMPGADGSTLELPEADETPAAAAGDGGQEETSFISDFSPSDIDALQEETGEVDPAAEADVYIAYGRYQQAESLINQAIDKAPNRLDLKLKLLEIYFTTSNAASFVQQAESLASVGAQQRDPKLWERVQSMGQELVPGHALFGSSGDGEPLGGGRGDSGLAPASVSLDSHSMSDSEAFAGLDLDLESELSELSEQPLDFGGDSMGLPDGAMLNVPDQAKPDDTLRMQRKPADETVRMSRPQANAPVEESEFALDIEDLDSLEDIDLGDLGEESIPAPEVDSGLDDLSPLSQIPDEEEEVSALSLDDLDGLGQDFDSLDEDSEVSSSKLADLLGDTGQGEEVETKLDLARAYMEMGDSEGAKEILEEVMQEGNDKQKQEAQGLIDQLD